MDVGLRTRRRAPTCSSTTRSTPTTSTRTTSAGATAPIGQAIAFARAAGVAHLVPFHHDPAHDDDTLDAMFDRARDAADGLLISPAQEGTTLVLP